MSLISIKAKHFRYHTIPAQKILYTVGQRQNCSTPTTQWQTWTCIITTLGLMIVPSWKYFLHWKRVRWEAAFNVFWSAITWSGHTDTFYLQPGEFPSLDSIKAWQFYVWTDLPTCTYTFREAEKLTVRFPVPRWRWWFPFFAGSFPPPASWLAGKSHPNWPFQTYFWSGVTLVFGQKFEGKFTSVLPKNQCYPKQKQAWNQK